MMTNKRVLKKQQKKCIHFFTQVFTNEHPTPPGLHIHFGEISVCGLPDKMQSQKQLKRTIFSAAAAAADQIFQPNSL